MPAGSKTSFPTWDQMVAEAQSQVEGIETYQLPLGDVEMPQDDGSMKTEKDVVIEIPCPDGVRYLNIVNAQKRGDAVSLLNLVVQDIKDRALIISSMQGVPWPIVDVFTNKVLRHYYGFSIEVEEKSGNSSGS